MSEYVLQIDNFKITVEYYANKIITHKKSTFYPHNVNTVTHNIYVVIYKLRLASFLQKVLRLTWRQTL